MQKKKSKIILKVLKLQIWITAMFFLAYIISIGIGEKGSFLSDLNNKKRVAGAAVNATLRIFGPPEKPLILGNSICNRNGFSIMNLNWNSVVDATSYDVYRDGEALAVDLTDNFFVDENVSNSSSYSYYVIANGPAGSAISDEKIFLTKKCSPQELPIVKISIFEGRNMFQIDGIPTTTNLRPFFQGQTNIPFTTIELEIHSEQVVYASTQANANGHWQWSPPVNISLGVHTLFIKVQDLIDPNIIATDSITFEIIEVTQKADEKEDGDSDNNKDSFISLGKDYSKEKPLIDNKTKKPFDFNISVENEAYIKGISVASEAYRGESVKTILDFNDVLIESNAVEISYKLIDSDKKTVGQYSQQINLTDGLRVEKIIPLPMDLKLGEYKLIISATIDSVIVSHESKFILKDKPLLKIGAAAYVTYPNLIDKLSWLFIISTIFLSFFSILALREHHLYKQAVFHITEKVLKRRGFIN